MKKLFTLLLISLTGTWAFGQRVCDVSVQSIDEPVELQSEDDKTPIPMNIALLNDGPDDLKAGDSIRFLMQVVVGSQVVTQTTNAGSGNVVFGGILHRDVTPGDTFHFVTSLNSQVIANYTFECSFVVGVLMFNRPDLAGEDQSTQQNNIKNKQILFYNKYRYPLSTSAVQKNGVAAYPVPANEQLTVSPATLDVNSPATVRVYDVNGKEVRNVTFSNFDGQAVIDVKDLDNGVYFVKVNNGEAVTSTRVVVQH